MLKVPFLENWKKLLLALIVPPHFGNHSLNWSRFQNPWGLFHIFSRRQLRRQWAQLNLKEWCLTSSWGLQLPQQLTRMPRGRPRLTSRWRRGTIACNCLLQITLNNLQGNRCTKCINPVNSSVMQQEIGHRNETIGSCKYSKFAPFPYSQYLPNHFVYNPNSLLVPEHKKCI